MMHECGDAGEQARYWCGVRRIGERCAGVGRWNDGTVFMDTRNRKLHLDLDVKQLSGRLLKRIVARMSANIKWYSVQMDGCPYQIVDESKGTARLSTER